MPVVSKPDSCGLRKRRKGCDEECLRRIAARLCQLNESPSSETHRITEESPATSGGCCSTNGIPKDVGKSTCCSPSAGPCTPKEPIRGPPAIVEKSVEPRKIGEASCCKSQDDRLTLDPAVKGCGPGIQDCCNAVAEAKSCRQETKTSRNAVSESKACCGNTYAAKGCRNEQQPSSDVNKHSDVDPACEKKKDDNDSTPVINCVDDCCAQSTKSSSSSRSCADECCDKLSDDAGYTPDITRLNGMQATFDRFEAMMQRGLCLCRKVQAELGFNCCVAQPDGLTTASKAPGPAVEKRSLSCAQESPKGQPIIQVRESQNQVDGVTNTELSASKERERGPDIENAAAREHVVVRVSGMTCTGCSKKMLNVLNNIPAVSNANVIFVSGTAEWDLAPTNSLNDVLRRVEKETGFTINQMVGGYQHLSVCMSREAATQLERHSPTGLVSITQGKNGVYDLTYNPQLVGARSLIPSSAVLAPPSIDKSVAEGRRRFRSMAANFATSAILTIPIVVLNWAETNVSDQSRDIVSAVLATLVVGIAIPEFYVGAVKSLVYSRVLEMDMLVVISVTVAYVYSVVAFGLTEAGIKLEQEAFFETSSLLVTLVLLGRLMSALARVRAVSTVSLRSLQVTNAILVGPEGQASTIDSRLLQYGDTVRVPAHSRVVTDGKVISGESAMDESMITGESTLVRKQRGDEVSAGTLNNSGTLDISMSRLPGDNSITDISDLVQSAIAAKPRIQDLADKLASYFVPTVIAISLLVFVIWIAIAVKIRNQGGGGAFGLAITYGIAALAVSCPCALGLAVPMVLVVAGGVSARAGVIVKASDALERGYRSTHVVFDKTGTLTMGDVRVVKTQAFEAVYRAKESLSILKALVTSNEHPVSVAVASHLAEQPLEKVKLKNIRSFPGAGIQAVYQGLSLKAGNPYCLGLDRQPEVAAFLEEAMTVLCVTLDNQLLLAFGLRSSLRPEALRVVGELHRRRMECHIVSGDASQAVESVAKALNIDRGNVAGRSSPADKQKYVQALQDSGNKVIFVGDGTNDAVAVAQANVGVQVGSASDVTGAVADVVLLGGLDGILTLLDISKAAFRRIMFNFAWTLVYNVLAILMAAGAFIKFRIPPSYAGLGEIASVAPVILAAMSMTLRRKMSCGTA